MCYVSQNICCENQKILTKVETTTDHLLSCDQFHTQVTWADKHLVRKAKEMLKEGV